MTDAIEALKRLPGVGVKSAARMVVHLLQHDRQGAMEIARALKAAVEDLHHCERCHTFTDGVICATCQDPARDPSRLCVVESPADEAAMERTGVFKGLYFVLMGKLSPLDGIGPQEIGVAKLLQRLDAEREHPVVREVILATSFTAEGEVTAHFLSQALKARGIAVTRLARGIPIGSDLEYLDLGTIAHALVDRR
jgi:recombination protein RecR